MIVIFIREGGRVEAFLDSGEPVVIFLEDGEERVLIDVAESRPLIDLTAEGLAKAAKFVAERREGYHD